MEASQASMQQLQQVFWLRARGFRPEQIAKLVALKRSYGRDRGGFCPKERQHLEFLRWLYKRGILWG